ncbi:unnamed protein product [Lactuca virosa]|uniref:Uncharacterized protein n=1 Tax=Lactuca virosa TaxID=75947 RepID=A0AAU9NHA0_9ASTR|nr:unnamed protein product [Lactuca virosa]
MSLFSLQFRAMFRAMNKRKGRRGYDQLISESTIVDNLPPEPKMIRSTSLPANSSSDFPVKVDLTDKQMRKVRKVHPLYSLLEKRRKKKATAKPEFSRYLEYLKEGEFSRRLLRGRVAASATTLPTTGSRASFRQTRFLASCLSIVGPIVLGDEMIGRGGGMGLVGLTRGGDSMGEGRLPEKRGRRR